MVDAANAYVTALIAPDEDYVPPADVKQATLLIAAHWWERRETAIAEGLHDIPLNAANILVNQPSRHGSRQGRYRQQVRYPGRFRAVAGRR
ncbi:head-tail connector protein [Bosea minatitlanensis]|uniref:Head-tail connector protein n=1 Tax=Bosea minatitlanensis TaxID=128782 RepID=A0ABW0EY52_9HYPH